MSFETFRQIGNHEKTSLQIKEPKCVNGIINIHKYKVTIELIDEPKEIIQERLQKNMRRM